MQHEYNDFQQLIVEYQSHEGAVKTSTTPKVQYSFADGSDNTIRLTGTVYPNGRVLTYDYGTSGGIDDSVSRIAAIIDDDTTHLVDYQYLGRQMFVVADSPQPDMQWTLVDLSGSNDPDTGDIYSGLDRFGRTKDCRWYENDNSTDLVRLKYGYDRDSNRLWRQDDVARSLSQNFDELLTYDGLQRLQTFGQGLLDGTHSSLSNQNYAQCWNLDATENWTGMKQAVGGTTWTLEQSRTANTVNEITDITNSVGSAWAEPAYDPAGNMQVIPQPDDPTQSLTGTWDAWNRLVKLVDDGTSDTVSEYEYDAQSRRIVKKLYDSGSLDQTRHIYLSMQNQVLEERVDSTSTPDQQNIWGLMYIDGLVLRDRTTSSTLDERLYCLQDTNWNSVALANESGAVTQRFAYQPFGTCQFLGASYTSGTNTSNWTTLFTGRELDLESGLYYFRARYVHPTLGVFLARDPLGYIDGVSLMALIFVPNMVDPKGLYCDDPCKSALDRNNVSKPKEVSGVGGRGGPCKVVVECGSNCGAKYGSANRPTADRVIQICINSNLKDDRELDVVIQHELAHAENFCKQNPIQPKDPCEWQRRTEEKAFRRSCSIAFPPTEQRDKYQKCVKCGVTIALASTPNNKGNPCGDPPEDCSPADIGITSNI